MPNTYTAHLSLYFCEIQAGYMILFDTQGHCDERLRVDPLLSARSEDVNLFLRIFCKSLAPWKEVAIIRGATHPAILVAPGRTSPCLRGPVEFLKRKSGTDPRRNLEMPVE